MDDLPNGPRIDGREREEMFGNFASLAFVGALHVFVCLVALLIGGVLHHWIFAFFWLAVGSITAVFGFYRINWKPLAAVLVLALATAAAMA